MAYAFDPEGRQYGVKVGRSRDTRRRAAELGACHNFRMVIHAIFPGKGHLEMAVHDRLNWARMSNGSSIEWFRVTPPEAIAAANSVIIQYPDSAWLPQA
jgi:hypothetical protein